MSSVSWRSLLKDEHHECLRTDRMSVESLHHWRPSRGSLITSGLTVWCCRPQPTENSVPISLYQTRSPTTTTVCVLLSGSSPGFTFLLGFLEESHPCSIPVVLLLISCLCLLLSKLVPETPEVLNFLHLFCLLVHPKNSNLLQKSLLRKRTGIHWRDVMVNMLSCVRCAHTTQHSNSLTLMLDQLLMSQDISSCWSKVRDLSPNFFLPLSPSKLASMWEFYPLFSTGVTNSLKVGIIKSFIQEAARWTNTRHSGTQHGLFMLWETRPFFLIIFFQDGRGKKWDSFITCIIWIY